MTDKEKLEKIKSLSDKMYTSMQNLTTDTAPIRKAMNEYHQFIIQHWNGEESVSEDLKDASMVAYPIKHKENKKGTGEYDSNIPRRKAFIAGSNWKEEQMMESAESGEIGYWNQRGLSIRLDKSLEDIGFDENDKVKVLIIKEEEK